MGQILRRILIAVAALSILQAPSPAQAGLFKKIGPVGAVVAGVEAAAIADATVNAIGAVGTAALLANLSNLKSTVAAHRFIGPPAIKLGIAAWLRLEPRKLAAALAVKADTIGNGGGSAARPVSAPNSATGDPNDDEPEEGQKIAVGRKLVAEDLGLKGENVPELRGRVTLEGNTLTVRIDMIRGAGAPQEETLGTSGLTIMRSLQALARENGASVLRIQGTLANETLESVLVRRYGAQMMSENGVETITMAVK
jgi:hypothetical protein